MRVYRTTRGIVIQAQGQFYLSKHTDWDQFVSRSDLFFSVAREIQFLRPDPGYWDYIRNFSLPAIGSQEIWTLQDHPQLLSTASRCCNQEDSLRRLNIANGNAGIAFLLNPQGKMQGLTLVHILMDTMGYPYQDHCSIGPCLWIPEPDKPLSWQIMTQVMRENVIVSQIQQSISWQIPPLLTHFWSQQRFSIGMYLIQTQTILSDLQAGDRLKTTLAQMGSLLNRVTT
ncbi:MAG: hypothetical protein ACK4LB_12005 [Spirosomataceae bacterium]